MADNPSRDRSHICTASPFAPRFRAPTCRPIPADAIPLCSRARLDRGEIARQQFRLHVQIVFGLHVHEPLRIDVEEAAKAQGDIGRYALTAVADLMNAAACDM